MTLIELLSGSPLTELPREGLYVKFHDALNVSEGFKRWLDHMVAPYAVQRFASAQLALEGLEKPEYLAVLEHRKTLSPSHGKQELSPYLWIQEKPDAFILEINSEKFNVGHFLRATVWTVFFLAAFFITNYFLMGWFSDALLAIPDLKGAVGLRDILGLLLSIIVLTLVYLWIHKRYVGVAFSPRQTLHLDNDALTFTFLKSRGLRKPQKKVRIYPLKNLRGIRFCSHQLKIELHRPQRGFRIHVITPQTSFSKSVRETLVEVTQKRGVSAHV